MQYQKQKCMTLEECKEALIAVHGQEWMDAKIEEARKDRIQKDATSRKGQSLTQEHRDKIGKSMKARNKKRKKK